MKPFLYLRSLAVVLVGLIFLLLNSLVLGQGWKDLDEAIAEGFEQTNAKAEQGDSKAQFNLAMMYSWGSGVEKDDEKFDYWIKKAAEQEYPPALMSLAVGFLNREDPEKFLELATKAAEQGYCEAMRRLGAEYSWGGSLPEDFEKSKMWYSQGAERECAECQYHLGGFYKSDNRGTPQDLELYEGLLIKAAERGSSWAPWELHLEYYSGKLLKLDYEKAFKWALFRAQESSQKPSKLRVAEMYDEGKGVAQDYRKAAKWYAEAAEDDEFNKGDFSAQTRLGEMYADGIGVLQDYEEAIKWYSKAAEQDWYIAQFQLAWMYSEGKGVPKDSKQAHKWYMKAAVNGSDAAKNNLGVQYRYGDGALQDYSKAHMWYNLAALGGDEQSRSNRDAVAEIMTSEQIAEAQKMAREWMEEHGEK